MCCSVLLKTNINYNHTVSSNKKKDNDPLLSHMECFLFLLLFDSDRTFVKLLMRFIGKQGKRKKTIFFSFQLNQGLNKGMNIFPLMYTYDLICCQPCSITFSFTETNRESSVVLGLSCQGVKSYD